MDKNCVKRYSLSRQISDRLENMIANGEYKIGDKIPTEVELMELFNVSRNTIREAIQSLVSVGVLVVKQGDGTYVRSNNRFNANMNLKYKEVSINEIIEVRNVLEIKIVELATKRRTEEDIKEIELAFLKRRELSGNIKEDIIADVNFHMAIAKASHNKILYDLYESMYCFLESEIYERQIKTNMNHTVIDDLHEKLFLAIKNGDVEIAISCIENILNI